MQKPARDPLSDFRIFLFVVWKFLGLPEPTPIQYDIANWLQQIYRKRGPRRAIIEAFRGVGKSWITVAFVCWALYLNPQLKILVVSASKFHADNFTTFAMRLIMDMPELIINELPNVGLGGDKYYRPMDSLYRIYHGH